MSLPKVLYETIEKNMLNIFLILYRINFFG